MLAPEIQREYEYVAYIDEAGDPGLRRIGTKESPGSTEWFILGCVLVRREVEPEIPKIVGEWLSSLSITQRSFLHYRDLSPAKREAACKLVASNKNVVFAVCSHKLNMVGYKNDKAAAKSQDQNWFYNYLARLLLERVSDFVLRDSNKQHGGPKKVKLEFASRALQRFTELAAYLEKLRIQTMGKTLVLNKRKIEPSVLDFMQVRSYNAADRAGLQIADVVASAFYEAVSPRGDIRCNPENAKLLKPRLAFERVGNVSRHADYGLVLQPARPALPALSSDQRQIFEYYGYEFQSRW